MLSESQPSSLLTGMAHLQRATIGRDALPLHMRTSTPRLNIPCSSPRGQHVLSSKLRAALTAVRTSSAIRRPDPPVCLASGDAEDTQLTKAATQRINLEVALLPALIGTPNRASSRRGCPYHRIPSPWSIASILAMWPCMWSANMFTISRTPISRTTSPAELVNFTVRPQAEEKCSRSSPRYRR